jgi:hypothetical protein
MICKENRSIYVETKAMIWESITRRNPIPKTAAFIWYEKEEFVELSKF